MGRYKDKSEWVQKGNIRINPTKAKAYNTEYVAIAERLVATGASQEDLAFLFGTSLTNFKKWKRENPEFKQALKRGKELTKAYLVAQGIKTAAGYTFEDKIIEYVAMVDENGNEIIQEDENGNKLAKIKKIKKTVPPNERMLMFLLSALDRQLGNDDWVNKQLVETKVDKTITHKIDTDSVIDQINKLSSGVKHIDSQIVEPDIPLLKDNNE